MSKERLMIYALTILLFISMITNDNCEVKSAADSILQPFFFGTPAEVPRGWEK